MMKSIKKQEKDHLLMKLIKSLKPKIKKLVLMMKLIKEERKLM